MNSIWHRVLQPEVIVLSIPIVAIIFGTLLSAVKRAHKHRERMAMIAAGMHPDYPLGDEPEDDEENFRKM